MVRRASRRLHLSDGLVIYVAAIIVAAGMGELVAAIFAVLR
jgi:hypothetical protein